MTQTATDYKAGDVIIYTALSGEERVTLVTEKSANIMNYRPGGAGHLLNDKDSLVWFYDAQITSTLGSLRSAAAFRCPECQHIWLKVDDPNEWAYGHDCEV